MAQATLPHHPRPTLSPRTLWKWVSEVKKWSTFGPLNFFIFRYIKDGVLGNNNISIKKCTTTFLWVLNLGQVGELPHRFSKSDYYGDFFQKWSLTCRSYKVFLRSNFKVDFLFRKKFRRISFLKLKANWINFKGIFHIRLKAKYFKTVVFSKRSDPFRRDSLYKI